MQVRVEVVFERAEGGAGERDGRVGVGARATPGDDGEPVAQAVQVVVAPARPPSRTACSGSEVPPARRSAWLSGAPSSIS